ncbi:MAG: Cyclic 2,3-diphosphoglycerate synthetase [Candidatus Heimdallarchaeota archaeon LC_3]|nr:MAG: Cyclic 2,3-diphosphoglycerate synthetase [Candidatus Heimdallarchaeota archaeon LC_3]
MFFYLAIKIIIMGAAGRDFHNFNTFFRNNESYQVVCFTATQIPDIAERKYPPELSGPLYPEGIQIYDETELINLITKHEIDQVVLAYSDLPHVKLMQKASRILMHTDFRLMGYPNTSIKSKLPVISICAVRTGAGKSQTTRKIGRILRENGKKVAILRHPMPYGDLSKQIWQRFGELADLDKHKCTIEEREEYEPHIIEGNLVFAGVDYKKILEEAEKEVDIIIWDGGNNDFSFYKSDLTFTIVDPYRPNHEITYYPGQTNLGLADVVIVNKVNTAPKEGIETVLKNIQIENPGVHIIKADSKITVDNPDLIKGKTVLVVEDGPTLTHGGMKIGAGIIAAESHGAKEIIDPRPFAVGSIISTFEKYDHLDRVLPAMGYGSKQMQELQETIEKASAEVVVIGTPIDLRKLIEITKPSVRVKYDLVEKEGGTIEEVLKKKGFI